MRFHPAMITAVAALAAGIALAAPKPWRDNYQNERLSIFVLGACAEKTCEVTVRFEALPQPVKQGEQAPEVKAWAEVWRVEKSVIDALSDTKKTCVIDDGSRPRAFEQALARCAGATASSVP